ncbi:MAG: transcriptional repressor [Caldilineaceae bacterium]|nr:transcriptional repressor [Caldilineaceae bacterium]
MNESLQERIRTAGYKLTPARLAVLQVMEREDEHLNPAEILDAARTLYPRIGRATVYRTLELLTRLGIVRPIFVGEDGPLYIRAQGGHHHMVCSSCGRIIDFDQCVAGAMIDDLRSRYGFEADSHLLEFYGVCRECRDH